MCNTAHQTDRHIWVMVGGCNFWTRCSVISISLERQEVIGIGGKKKGFPSLVKGSSIYWSKALSRLHTHNHTHTHNTTHTYTQTKHAHTSKHTGYTSLRFGALDPGRQVALFRITVCRLGELGEVEGGGGGSNHYYAFRRTVALRIFSPCSRAGRHIPLALLSGLFPAAGGFCQPLPHCPSFLCSLAPTMAFFSAS